MSKALRSGVTRPARDYNEDVLTDEEITNLRGAVEEAAITSGCDSLGWPEKYAKDVIRLLAEIERLRAKERRLMRMCVEHDRIEYVGGHEEPPPFGQRAPETSNSGSAVASRT